MRKAFAAVVLAMFFVSAGAHAADRINSDYRGADAGTLIFSTGSVFPMNFTFYYRKAGQGTDPTSIFGAGEIDCACVGFWHAQMSDPDYVGPPETGKVFVQHLPPGDYEVYTYGFSGTIIVASVSWSPRKVFSLPFSIKPGQATYIGNFVRGPSLGTKLEPTLGAAGFFMISDKHERDIEIARRRDPGLPPVTVSVTDVSNMGDPMIFASDPR